MCGIRRFVSFAMAAATDSVLQENMIGRYVDDLIVVGGGEDQLGGAVGVVACQVEPRSITSRLNTKRIGDRDVATRVFTSRKGDTNGGGSRGCYPDQEVYEREEEEEVRNHYRLG